MAAERHISLDEAAQRAQVHKRTVRRWVAQGLIDAYRLGPRVVRVDVASLDALPRRIPTAGQAGGRSTPCPPLGGETG